MDRLQIYLLKQKKRINAYRNIDDVDRVVKVIIKQQKNNFHMLAFFFNLYEK